MQTTPKPFEVSADTKEFLESIPKGKTYIEEAEFGLRRILPVLANKPDSLRVLEVGSGPCIVLSELARRFPKAQFQGIEPMSHGFAHFDDFISKVQRVHPSLNVHIGGYESFDQEHKWDLIFLINVFEHLPDWRHFLDFVEDRLAPSGQCVALFPNYGFPYESHFGFPVVFNKTITERLFADRVARFEKENDYIGLFHSLNFVKLSKVRQEAKFRGLKLEVQTDVMLEMINRLETDPQFAARQGVFSLPARMLNKSGILEWAFGLKWVQNILPYVQIQLAK